MNELLSPLIAQIEQAVFLYYNMQVHQPLLMFCRHGKKLQIAGWHARGMY